MLLDFALLNHLPRAGTGQAHNPRNQWRDAKAPAGGSCTQGCGACVACCNSSFCFYSDGPAANQQFDKGAVNTLTLPPRITLKPQSPTFATDRRPPGRISMTQAVELPGRSVFV